jgi:hypothetical protein
MKTNVGHCPECKNTVSSVEIEEVGGGVTYLCSVCKCVLGVGPDPKAVEKDIAAAVKRSKMRAV